MFPAQINTKSIYPQCLARILIHIQIWNIPVCNTNVFQEQEIRKVYTQSAIDNSYSFPNMKCISVKYKCIPRARNRKSICAQCLSIIMIRSKKYVLFVFLYCIRMTDGWVWWSTAGYIQRLLVKWCCCGRTYKVKTYIRFWLYLILDGW